jgi:hypothetical protein
MMKRDLGAADEAGPEGEEVVLGVADVDEFDGGFGGDGGGELVPVAPVGAVADAVDVLRVGLQAGERDGMVSGEGEIGLQGFGGGADEARFAYEAGPVLGEGDLGGGRLDGGFGAPSDGGGGGGVAGPGEDDAVGDGGGLVYGGGGDFFLGLSGEVIDSGEPCGGDGEGGEAELGILHFVVWG